MSRWDRFVAFARPRMARGAYAQPGDRSCMTCAKDAPGADPGELFGTGMAIGSFFEGKLDELPDVAPLPFCETCAALTLEIGNALQSIADEPLGTCPCVGFVPAFKLQSPHPPQTELACAGFAVGVSLERVDRCPECAHWFASLNRSVLS